MGLFEVQRELATERARKKKTAGAKARSLAKDPSALVDDAWASDLDPKTLGPLYQKLAKKDPAIELALARLGGNAEAMRALIEENAELVAPLVTSRLKTDAIARAAQILAGFGARAKRAAPAVRGIAERSSDENVRLWCAWALAAIGDADDVAFAAKIAGAKAPPQLVAALAQRGSPPHIARAIDQVRTWLDARTKKHMHRDDAQPALAAIGALGEVRSQDALPVLHEALGAPYVAPVMRALLSIADPSTRDPIEALLAKLAGDPERRPSVSPSRGKIFYARSRRARRGLLLDSVSSRAHALHPERYGWPKVDDWADLVAHAVSAPALQGNNEDVAQAARFANAPFRFVRAAALPAVREASRCAARARHFGTKCA